MPEQSKFSGALAKLKERPAEQPAAEPGATSIAESIEAARGKGRPPGKRSDPNYQPTTILLRKQTKKTAARLLEDANSGQDLSELIEQLLAEWTKQHA